MAEELKSKKILVTGGAGFIGSHIVAKLVELGSKIVVLDNLVSGKIENISAYMDKITFIKKDLREDSALEEALEGVELVSHQAALRSVPKSVGKPLEYHDVNVSGTLNLLLKAKKKGVKRVVSASSSSVYGDREDFPEKETDYPKPVSPYAATKLMGEIYAHMFTKLYGVEVVSLRYFNVYGPRQSLEDEYAVVIPKFITSLLEGKQPPIYDDGTQERDFTYIEDVVSANIKALVQAGVEGEFFNIASGNPNSVNTLLKYLKEILNSGIEPVYLPPRPGDVRKTHADISKAGSLLGWKPVFGFREGLEKTAEWFKNSIKR